MVWQQVDTNFDLLFNNCRLDVMILFFVNRLHVGTIICDSRHFRL